MSTTKELIELVEKQISKFDPTPIIVNNDYPLRWESNINIADYDFYENYLDLDKDYESQRGEFLKSVKTAIVVNKEIDGSLEYWDGVYMSETHTWCSKLNSNEEFPSFSLINEKFKSVSDLKSFLADTYG
jgi:hypothetical protein